MPNVVHVYALANWLNSLPTATAMLAECWSGHIGPTGPTGPTGKLVNTTCTSLDIQMIIWNYKILSYHRGIAGYDYTAVNNGIP